MGNWRNRPPRRFHHQNRSPRKSYDPEFSPHSRFEEDGVPSWEKKFCYVIGSVPWRKVVYTQKFMYGHNSILKWDDSAGEEAFQNAKKRYWAEINGIPCHISPPDPDIYLDDINWNPYIDPELIKDLERDFFVPDEGERDSKAGCGNKKTLVSVPSEKCDLNAVDAKNPWECTKNGQTEVIKKDESQGWNQCDTTIHNNNPWEHDPSQGNEAVKYSTWGDSGEKSWGWNHSGNYANHLEDFDNGGNPWECSHQDFAPEKSKGWVNSGDSSWDNAYSFQSRKLNNGSNAWESSFNESSQTSAGKGWTNGGGNAWGWKQRDSYSEEPKVMNFKKRGGGWGAWNEGCRNSNGAHHHVTGYKSTRFEGDEYQTSRGRRGGKTKKRVSFAYE